MKYRTILAAGAIGLGCMGEVLAQNEADALRYSQLQPGGTARIQGMAGAQSALGGDLSTISGNPAGLGLYRRSDLGLSMGLNFGNTSSRFQNETTLDNKGNFNIPHFGLVINSYKGDDYEGDWKSVSFGLSYTRVAHLHNRFTFDGVNPNSSITEYFNELRSRYNRSAADLDDEVDGGNDISTLEGLAYYNFLINPDTLGGFHPAATGPMRQREEIMGRGAVNQWDFGFGANYRDMVFLGGSLGLTSVNYRQERTFTETPTTGSNTALSSLSLTDEFRTSGSGINLKLGAIVKPVDWVRFGATIQTPTFFNLKDSYNTRLSTTFERDLVVPNSGTYTTAGKTLDAQTVPGVFEYNLTTPFRASGGVALFAGKAGFLTADVEYVNYGQARFSADDTRSNFSPTNNTIGQIYQSAVNVRVGAEGRYEIFRFRAGYGHYGDPFTASTGTNRTRSVISVGGGIRQENFYLDLALVNTRYNSVYSPYTLSDRAVPSAITKNTYNNFVVTAGVVF